jgi:hypothetical protein
VNPLHPKKVCFLIVVIEDGINNVPVKWLQLPKAASPIEVTEEGIVNTPVKALQLAKAYTGIVLTLLPIFNVLNALHSDNTAFILGQLVAL